MRGRIRISMGGKLWNAIPLRRRLLIYFFAAVFLIGILSSVLYYNMAEVLRQFNSVYNNLNTLEKYSDSIEVISANLNKYLSEGDRTYISAFYSEYEALLNEMKNTRLSFTSKEDNMQFVNMGYMLETYGSEAESAINEYRKRNLEDSSDRLSRALKIQSYMQDGIEELTLSYIEESKIFQKSLLRQMVVLRTFMTFLIIMSAVFYALFAVFLNRALVRPVDKLVKMADRISRGDFEVEKISIDPHNELRLLSDTMYRMSSDIKSYIEEIKDKAEMKSLLQAKEMENLKITALLQETELKRLQAQMDPHFLFNTLTTIHHTAFLEGADETCRIAEAVSKILRYNLGKSDTAVRLKDEMENIRYYVYIQEKRYKHRVKVHFNIDEELLDMPIPNMTVQPIVENSFIHGIENNEAGGEISIGVYREGASVVVEIKDKGAGIEEDKLRQIRGMINEELGYRGHTTGIGINNVTKRLQAFYGIKDVFDIESTVGGGTVTKLFLPYSFLEGARRKSAGEVEKNESNHC